MERHLKWDSLKLPDEEVAEYSFDIRVHFRLEGCSLALS